MNSSSKKAIAAVAALLILLYHCWIPVFSSGTFFGSLERFLIASTYFGVDIFFFISAFSLVSSPVADYRSFILNRALKLLPLFFIALIADMFLWFIPAIMVMYLLLPPLHRVCRKRPVLSFFLLFIGWAVTVYLILGVIRPAWDIGLFLFRIPSIILGAYAVNYKDKLSRRASLISGFLLLAAGSILIYRFGYLNRLNVPFRGTFYLLGIPVAFGEILILYALSGNHSSRLIERFGSMTLELYFSQMVFGAFLVRFFAGLTENRLAANVLTLSSVIISAYVLKYVIDWVMSREPLLPRIISG